MALAGACGAAAGRCDSVGCSAASARAGVEPGPSAVADARRDEATGVGTAAAGATSGPSAGDGRAAGSSGTKRSPRLSNTWPGVLTLTVARGVPANCMAVSRSSAVGATARPGTTGAGAATDTKGVMAAGSDTEGHAEAGLASKPGRFRTTACAVVCGSLLPRGVMGIVAEDSGRCPPAASAVGGAAAAEGMAGCCMACPNFATEAVGTGGGDAVGCSAAAASGRAVAGSGAAVFSAVSSAGVGGTIGGCGSPPGAAVNGARSDAEA